MTLVTLPASARGQARQILAGRAFSPRLSKGLVLAAALAAAVAGLQVTDGATAARAAALAGEGLTRLLRAMAAIKAVMATGALAGVLWRLESPVGPGRLATYALTCAAMAAGPGLIWSMANLGLGAALLHIGLIGALVVLWRDPETTRRLAATLAARRGRR